jgi:N-acetylneuraminic acid mutarotase
MSSTEETLAELRREVRPLLETVMKSVLTKVRQALEEAEQERAVGLVPVTEERAKGLSEVAEERAKELAEVDVRRTELSREIAAMHMHQEAQEGRVELNIGGHRFETSVQALRSVPHTFFDAYFSGRYAQDVCTDGSILVDRDGEHFGHVLECMRDGHVSVAEADARPSVSLLRALKREFGFYCMELYAEQPEQGVFYEQAELVFVVGGVGDNNEILSCMERYDNTSGQWSVMAAMSTARFSFGACVVAGELYVTGGFDGRLVNLSSVEKYSPSSDTWSSVTPLATARSHHASAAVGPAVYVFGGFDGEECSASVLKFDSTRGTWSEVAPMPKATYAHAVGMVGSDIYVFGGYDLRGVQQCSVYRYDTAEGAWTTLAPMPIVGACLGVTALDGQTYITGVHTGGRVLRFYPASGMWGSFIPAMHSRDQGSLFVLGGCLHVVGGNETSVERYDAATDTWTAVADMLEGRRLCGAVTIPAAGPAEEENLFDALIAKTTR